MIARRPGMGLLLIRALGVIALGVAIGLGAVPRSAELQRIEFHASRFRHDPAPPQPAALASMGTADTFEQARLQYAAGRLDVSIRLIEKLAGRQRLDNVGREVLAHYYGQAQRPELQRATLLPLARTHLNAADSRELLGQLRAEGDADFQLYLLESMRSRGFTNQAETRELARLYRHAERYADATRLQRELFEQDPEKASDDDVRTLVRLLHRVRADQAIPAILGPWVQSDIDERTREKRFGVLLALGEFETIIEFSTTRDPNRSLTDPFYRRALFELHGTHPLYAEAYVDSLLSDLVAVNGARSELRILHDLFELVPADTAYAMVLASGYEDVERARNIYYATLQHDGREQELALHLANDATDAAGSLVGRRAAADRIAALERYDVAETSYRELASIEGADSASMEGLMYSWRRLSREPDIDWVGRRMLASGGREYASWESRFTSLAEPRRLLDWLERHAGDAGTSTRLALDTQVRLAAWEPRMPRLRKALERRVADGPVPKERFERYLQLACDNGYTRIVLSMAAQVPDDAVITAAQHVCIARRASASRHDALAVRHYRAADRTDPLERLTDLIDYAAAADGVGDPALLTKLNRRALGALPALEASNRAESTLRGQLALALQDKATAIDAFERSLAMAGSSTGAAADVSPTSLAGTIPALDDLALRKLLMELHLEAGHYAQVLALACRDSACTRNGGSVR